MLWGYTASVVASERHGYATSRHWTYPITESHMGCKVSVACPEEVRRVMLPQLTYPEPASQIILTTLLLEGHLL